MIPEWNVSYEKDETIPIRDFLWFVRERRKKKYMADLKKQIPF